MKTILTSLALTLTLTGTALAAGDWTIHRMTGDFDDKKVVITLTERGHQRLSFACKEGQFAAMVKLARLDLQFGGRKVVYRVDNQPPVTVAGRQAGKSEGVLWFGREAILFARAVAEAQSRIIVKNELDNGSFSIHGSTAAVNKILAACNL